MDEIYSFTHRNYISFSVTFSIFVHIDFYFPEYSLFPNFSFLLNSSLFLKSSMFPYFFFFQTISCTDCFLFLPLSSFLSFFFFLIPGFLIPGFLILGFFILCFFIGIPTTALREIVLLRQLEHPNVVKLENIT